MPRVDGSIDDFEIAWLAGYGRRRASRRLRGKRVAGNHGQGHGFRAVGQHRAAGHVQRVYISSSRDARQLADQRAAHVVSRWSACGWG